MNFPDANAFSHFLQSNNLGGLCNETSALINCLNEYARLCNGCDGMATAEAKKKSCTTLYINFVSKAANYKSKLFGATGGTVITFYDNQKYIGTITR
jgi:hypothetical protein